MSLQGLRDPKLGPGVAMAVGLGAGLASHRNAFLDPGASASSIPILDQWLYAPSMASPTLAACVFALLVLRRRAAIAAAVGAGTGSRFGLCVLAAGVALLLWSRQIGADHLAMFSLVVHVVGIASFVGGARLVRALASPIGVLLLAVPLPPELLHQIVLPLQLLAVSLASFGLDLVGHLHETRGDLIYSGEYVFHVVEGCCGFKSTLSVVLAAIVYADVVLARPAARAALALVAVPVGLVANGVRVSGLVVGRIPTESTAHTAYGIFSIAGAVVALVLLEITLSSAAARRARSRAQVDRHAGPASARDRSDRNGSPPAVGPRIWIVTAFAVLEAIAVEGIPIARWPAAQPEINIETLPERIAGRTASTIAGDDTFLGSVWFAHRIHRSYAAEGDPFGAVRVFVGLEDLAALDRSGFSPKTAIPGSGWQTIARGPDAVGAAGDFGSPIPWEERVVTYADRRTRVLHGRFGYAPWGLEPIRRWLGLDRAGLLGRHRTALVIRLELDDRGPAPERGWMILRQVARGVERWLEQAGGGGR